MPPSSGSSSPPSPSADAARPARPGRITVRFTAAGVAAVALLAGAGIVAVNSGNNLLYIVAASLLSLFALSGVLGYANLRGLAVRALPPDEVWAGRPASVRLEVANPRRRLPAFLITAALGGSRETLLEVPPGQDGELAVAVTFPRRGRSPWPQGSLASEFPFGLILRGTLLAPGGSCLVYPRPIPVPWEMVQGADRGGAERSRRTPGEGGDFRGLRAYAAGDRLTRVDWKGWLRNRRLQTREFEEEGGAPVTFDWDAVPGPGTEERLGQLAWLVRSGLRAGRSVGLRLPGRAFPPGSGPAHRRRLLEALALFGERP